MHHIQIRLPYLRWCTQRTSMTPCRYLQAAETWHRLCRSTLVSTSSRHSSGSDSKCDVGIIRIRQDLPGDVIRVLSTRCEQFYRRYVKCACGSSFEAWGMHLLACVFSGPPCSASCQLQAFDPAKRLPEGRQRRTKCSFLSPKKLNLTARSLSGRVETGVGEEVQVADTGDLSASTIANVGFVAVERCL